MSIIYWTSSHREKKMTSHLTQGRSHTRSEVFPNHNQAFTLETKSTALWKWYAPQASNFDKHHFVLQINWILRKEHMIITANNSRWLLKWYENKLHTECSFILKKSHMKNKSIQYKVRSTKHILNLHIMASRLMTEWLSFYKCTFRVL